MKKGEGLIIIKRKKKGHAAHHGGAWKVAYADFITAMMALFLVLWLLSIMSIKGKEGVGKYFRSYSVFKGEGEGGGKGLASVLPGTVTFIRMEELEKELESIKKKKEDEVIEKAAKDKAREVLGLKISKRVKEEINKLENVKFGDFGAIKDQVIIYTTQEGVRIELVEKSAVPMFELGRATLLPTGKDVFSAIAFVLRDLENEISIEGHTDSRNYPSEEYTNWELSADRANAARREFLKNGIKPYRFSRVSSFADTLPFKSDKMDPMNRRVSILIHVN